MKSIQHFWETTAATKKEAIEYIETESKGYDTVVIDSLICLMTDKPKAERGTHAFNMLCSDWLYKYEFSPLDSIKIALNKTQSDYNDYKTERYN